MPDRLPWRRLLFLAILVAAAWFGWREYQRLLREEPQLFPWTPLSLEDPVGSFTDDKLAALTTQPARCRALIDAAGLGDTTAPPVSGGAQCGYEDGMRLGAASGTRLDYGDLTTSCAVAAALALWERETVRPAALQHLGSEIVRIETFGSYSCRRLYGRDEGPFSEHATADAVDIAAFVLADGRRVSVVNDWTGDDDEAAFLRASRDGACGLFRTTLSPDYNAAHRDHFHLDMASGRPAGWSVCR